MPMIFCEVCDYLGSGRTVKARLKDVIDHEEREHARRYDVDWLFDKEMDKREEDAKLKMIPPDEKEEDEL